MAADMFLKIDGIEGESSDDKHKNEIEVESFSWGLTQTGSLAFGGGAGAGKAQFQDFHFVTNTSKASPKLFLTCAAGEHIKEATLTVRKSNSDSKQDYLFIKMNDVLISSYQTGGSQGGGNPVDQVSLNFAKIEYSFKPQKPDGSLDAAIVGGWDLKLNKKV
jgi:type VI secretion system secreted protein Hcp